ncbi:germin-like protein 2 [Rhynchospora pubera]|uniref:Germin-like protein n=1 Tax=Rhynchospora pubera TaxID=906938 RepID=A0AAV8BYQ6_9POAL|nr:germin-like protein 2 [Rhynchospora pubera]
MHKSNSTINIYSQGRKTMAKGGFVLAILALVAVQSLAGDPSPVQDFCVADLKSEIFVNGLPCKNPELATPDDFFFAGLDKPSNTDNKVGFNVTLVNAARLPSLNTLGVSIARLDYAPYGLNPPHTHPRGTEVLTVIEGTLLAGFISSNPDNKLFLKTLHPGDVFIFPVGLIHFQFNAGDSPAVAIAGFSSQNPGLIVIADALFDSNPPIPDDVLEKALQVDKKIIEALKAQHKV